MYIFGESRETDELITFLESLPTFTVLNGVHSNQNVCEGTKQVGSLIWGRTWTPMLLGRGAAPKVKSEARTPTLMLDSRISLRGTGVGSHRSGVANC